MTCNYLKNFKDQLKPVNSTLIEFLNILIMMKALIYIN